jgi:hypothetical protein
LKKAFILLSICLTSSAFALPSLPEVIECKVKNSDNMEANRIVIEAINRHLVRASIFRDNNLLLDKNLWRVTRGGKVNIDSVEDYKYEESTPGDELKTTMNISTDLSKLTLQISANNILNGIDCVSRHE